MGNKSRINELLIKHGEPPMLENEYLESITIRVLGAALKELGIGDEPKPGPVLYCGICNEKCKNRFHDGESCRGFEPAEPVVLSAEEWVDRQPFRSIEDENGTVKLFRSKRLFTFDQMTHACETFKQNGRLEMWLEFNKAFDNMHKPGNFQPLGFKKALENLKPLNQD